MIRRDVIRPGRPDGWLLISQVDHARLAFELARDWQQGGVAPLEPRVEVLKAILHHDDGWSAWERSPEVDPKLGRPLSFLEMPIDEAVEIWKRSITVASDSQPWLGATRRTVWVSGPLATYLVWAHFAALIDRAHGAHAANPHWLEVVDRFLEDGDILRDIAFESLRTAAGEKYSEAQFQHLAERGLKQLQLFDALSLWFCMAERIEPETFDTPDGPPVTWTPVSATEMTVDPWPWPQPELRVEVMGRLIPVGHYPDREALSRSPSETALLGWNLRPAN